MDWSRTLYGSAAWTLGFVSILAGAVMLWAFGKFSSQDSIRRVKDRLKANMLEMRLFVDEPVLIWRAAV